MPVTEIGLLRLKPSTTIDDPELQASLSQARKGLQEFTGKRFYYLQQVEDQSFIYLLGEWECLDQHYKNFHGTQEFQEELPKMKQYLEFQWMAHYDVPLADIWLDAPVLSVGRHMIKDGKREEFEKCFKGNRRHLDAVMTEGKTMGGWKVDDGRKGDEFVLLAPWKEVSQHNRFSKTEGFKECSQMEDFVEQADIKHIRLMKEL